MIRQTKRERGNKPMSFYSSGKLLSSPRLDSKIKSANVTNKERWLGYFLGPGGIIMLNAVIASYLNVFYTDVLKAGGLLGGALLALLPVVSKVIDAITNVIMGQIIDRTKSRQGKARPWILIGAPMVAISAVLLMLVPNASDTVKIVWIILSYNLYYCIAYTCYYMSHSMLVPLSTRNSKQRDSVAMLNNMALCIIPGMLVAMLFPMLILPIIGVNQGKWITMMVILGIIALPCAMLEYYFTKERITEESASTQENEAIASVKEQLKVCMKDKYWVMFMATLIIIQIVSYIQNISLIYYCNWVLGTYNDGFTQTIVSAIGNAPLGFGILIMWPLVGKFGKRKVMCVGLAVSIIGSALFCLNPTNMGFVLATLMIRAFGALPITYITMAMLAEAMDHVEWKAGFRVDGITMSIYTIICTVAAGVGLSIFNAGLGSFGYVPPASDGTWVAQNQAVQNFFVFGYQGLYAIAAVVVLIIFWFYKVEDDMPKIKADITARHKAEAAAKGIEWMSSEELAEREQAEQERLAEENRIRELKAKCAKKGLNFAEEEAKYQSRLAAKKAKEEAKKSEKEQKVNDK